MMEHLKMYLETGTTRTPCRGRGHRVSKKNARFIESPIESEEDTSKKVGDFIGSRLNVLCIIC